MNLTLARAAILSVVCSAALLAPPDAKGQDGAKKAPPKQTAQARELLSKAVDAAKKLKSLNYAVQVSTEGTPAPAYAGTVGAQRTEAGPWAILVSGTVTPAGGTARDVRVAYDGVTGRSVNDAEKVVTESNASSESDVRLFFMSQEAGPTVAWELLNPEPLAAAAKDAALEIVGRGNAAGADCKILQITPPAQGAAPAEVTRYFIPATDFLPRKIERVSRQGAGATTQTVLLTDLKADEKLAPSQFVISVPDGYTVKAANKKPPKPPKPQPKAAPTRSAGLAIGATAPNWKLKNSAGQQKSLADYKGKVIVMDFWGTWCPPCRMAMPAIQKVHEKFKGKPVAVLGLNFEQRASADPAAFMKTNGYTYELLLKADSILDDYQVEAFPTLIVIGMDGKVTFVDTGFKEELEAELTRAVEDALVQ